MKTDYRYWTIGDETIYIPDVIKQIAITIAVIVGLAGPTILLGVIAWMLW